MCKCSFFTRKYTLTDAFFIALTPIIFLWTSLLSISNEGKGATISSTLFSEQNYESLGKCLQSSNTLQENWACSLAKAQHEEFQNMAKYATNVDALWITKWILTIIVTQIVARFYYSRIKKS